MSALTGVSVTLDGPPRIGASYFALKTLFKRKVEAIFERKYSKVSVLRRPEPDTKCWQPQQTHPPLPILDVAT